MFASSKKSAKSTKVSRDTRPDYVHMLNSIDTQMPGLVPIGSRKSALAENTRSIATTSGDFDDEMVDRIGAALDNTSIAVVGDTCADVECTNKISPANASDKMNPLRSYTVPKTRYASTTGPRQKLCGSWLFDKVVTVVAEGIIDNTNDIFLVSGAKRFHVDIMQRSDQEVNENMAAAEKFFAEQFGLNFSNTPMQCGRKSLDDADFFGYQLNEDLDLRIYTVSTCKAGAVQPRGCQKIFAGGWAVRLNKEQTLGGRHADRDATRCRVYPRGTMLLFGDYLVRSFVEKEVTRCVETQGCDGEVAKKQVVETQNIPIGDDMVISFRSRTPLVSTVDMIIPTDLYVESTALGEGVSSGTIQGELLEHIGAQTSERTRVKLREVWEFPGTLLGD